MFTEQMIASHGMNFDIRPDSAYVGPVGPSNGNELTF